MTAILLAGALVGAGVLLVARGVRGGPAPAAALGSPGEAGVFGTGVGSQVGAAVLRGAAAMRWTPGRRQAADLAVTGRRLEEHAARSVLAGVWFAALAVAVTAGIGLGGMPVPLPITAGAALAAALAGPLVTTAVLRGEASERRQEFLVDLAAYADLVVLLLAAGSGIEGALVNAADAGDDWTWRALHDALRDARLTRQTPAEAFTSLGRRLGLVELEELGAAVALASSSGSRLRESLAARADTLRARELARVQAQAASATERMTFPVVALAVGFLVVLGFPAVTRVVSGF
ncbi:MAG TPA: type II secretion system F family protein [Acidimicrobiia bacterium]|nr:type II secretion system F family protein [Acidimicrobiia bacterium]